MRPSGPQSWRNLWLAAGCQSDAHPVNERLIQAYAEPQRHYHNFQHITECLEAFELVHDLARQPVAVELALWFHDAIYDPRAPDNEEKSAALATQLLAAAGASVALVEAVSRLVLATKHHAVGDDPDAALLIDVDLAILGQSEVRFQEYEAQIRREYAWVPAPVFAAKRAEILRRFLARDRVYTSEFFHAKLESAARVNLVRSIQGLDATI